MGFGSIGKAVGGAFKGAVSGFAKGGVAGAAKGAISGALSGGGKVQAAAKIGQALNPGATTPGTVKMEIPVHLAGTIAKVIDANA